MVHEKDAGLPLKRAVFIALALAAAIPGVTGPMALIAGIVFALAFGNPFPARTKQVQTVLLQVSVVGLGAAMNLTTVLRAGAEGAVETLVLLVFTLGLTWVFTKLLKTDSVTSLLIGVGTAICGGSAIAAASPAIGAKPHQTSVALAVVFLLNAIALVIFPPIGHALGMSEAQFGHWAALAIHDTSSVVGAAAQYGPTALEVGTTLKLTRALWIIPVTVVLARIWKSDAPKKWPFFILGFLAMAAWHPPYVADVARQLLVVTLFLVGSGVSREALQPRLVVLGILLWLCVAVLPLLAGAGRGATARNTPRTESPR